MDIWLWIGFTLFILLMLSLDLGLIQRRPHVISMKEALAWFAVWTGLALLFNIGIILFHERGAVAGLEFFTGFLVEKSLSIDNVFVFLLIFSYFQVPPAYQHKVLFWGIIGAIVLRVTFIVVGLALMERFHWAIYVFGAFLLATGIHMFLKKDSVNDPEKNWVIRSFRRHLSRDRPLREQSVFRPQGRTALGDAVIHCAAGHRVLRHCFRRRLHPRDLRHHARTRSSFTRPTSSQCSGCGHCTSRSRGSCRCSTSCTTGSLRSSRS